MEMVESHEHFSWVKFVYAQAQCNETEGFTTTKQRIYSQGSHKAKTATNSPYLPKDYGWKL